MFSYRYINTILKMSNNIEQYSFNWVSNISKYIIIIHVVKFKWVIRVVAADI